MRNTHILYLIIVQAIFVVHNNAALNNNNAMDCLTNSLEKSIFCRGSRAIRNVIHNLSKSDKPIVLMRGLEIVPVKDGQHIYNNDDNNESNTNATTAAAAESMPMSSTSTSTSTQEDDSFLGSFAQYLRTHELNIKFSDILVDESARNDGVQIDYNDVGATVEARKKDKGQGILLAMAVMTAKMMGVLGLGGIGALAMKALGVAMMALMMAGMVGLKSLSQQGHETSHSVSYVTADGGHHHKRRKRNSNRDYQAIITPATTASTTTTTVADDYFPQALVYAGWQRNSKHV